MAKEGWLRAEELPYPPRTEVRDKRYDRRGLLMGGIVKLTKAGKVERRELYLRPLDGGPEWPAAPADIEAVRP